MKNGFFIKTAFGNIKKNYRFFIPRILSEAGLLGVFYIFFTLKSDRRITQIRGGSYVGSFMSIGVGIMMILSTVMILYINSFLMKQRKREFGLYNILGMEKRHVDCVLFFESLIASTASFILGIGFGMLFYKLCSLLICFLLKTEVVIGFYFINAPTVISSILFFLLLDVLTYIFNVISIASMKPIDLLHSKNTGEREPKIKWVMLVIGFISLCAGYYISLTVKSPLSAILLFFLAIVLVIIGTYFLFVTGSIFVLKLLKRNKKYYYNKKHMPSVSGLLYRMKQNAVGLASICILATGVLVMISTTVSLYSGMQQTLMKNFPEDFYIMTSYQKAVTDYEEDGQVSGHIESVPMPRDVLERFIRESADEAELKISETKHQNYIEITYKLRNNRLMCEYSNLSADVTFDNLVSVTFISEDIFKALSGTEATAFTLGENEIALCKIGITSEYKYDNIVFAGEEYKIKTEIASFPIVSSMMSSAKCYGIVVKDVSVLEKVYNEQKGIYLDDASEFQDIICVSFDGGFIDVETGDTFNKSLKEKVNNYAKIGEDEAFIMNSTQAIWDARDALYGMYGTLLFLGLLLGFVFIFATVLIIYYKQISEGYEDRERFQIMQKIGMSNSEVKKTINSQVLLVFFLPLITAGIHLVFAFPILDKILKVMMLPSTKLFIICSIIVYLAFALVYVIIYSTTSKVYYKIVR